MLNNNNNNYKSVILIGYENQENLGLRSIMAYLQTLGYKVELIPFFKDKNEEVLRLVEKFRPELIGFSLIFQYSLDEFGKLMNYLRVNGIKSHFTAGGHFPSLCPTETLNYLKELDSVVLFEGELTLPELLDNLNQPNLWHNIKGLAYRKDDKVVITQPRPQIDDLDKLPTVFRSEPQEVANGLKMASMLASRGCLFNCSFCSIRQFYSGSKGLLRRIRSANAVVNEMQTLYINNGIRFFSFQDDDFAARTSKQRTWILQFLKALEDYGLSGNIRWKISCRVDDLEPDLLELMIDHGLIAVYLGVESGNEIGLLTLQKNVSVVQNYSAIELLMKYDLAIAIGFMLFDPSSTIDTIKENIKFLDIVGDTGYFPINFCKMLPYAGTPIEKQLLKAGRLKGTILNPDYDFFDSQLNWYAFLVQRIFTHRNFDPNGLLARLQRLDFEYRLITSFNKDLQSIEYYSKLRQLIQISNRQAIQTLNTLLVELVSHGAEWLIDEQTILLDIAQMEWESEAKVNAELDKLIPLNQNFSQPTFDRFQFSSSHN